MTPVLRTERLVLRLAEEDDVPALVRFFGENRDHMAPWEPPRPDHFLTEKFWRVQVERHHRAFENGAAVMLFMFQRNDPDEVAGQISLTSIVRGPADMCVIGYAIAQRLQGQGLMHEALRATIDYAFSALNLHRLMANFMPHNTRSHAVLRRLDFVIEGYAREYLYIGGEWRDHVLTSLTNPTWKASDERPTR